MIKINIGDCRNLIHDLDDNSIDCVMTSPPYWGLRDYGHEDQIGLEETPEQFLDNLVGLFSNIKDKLKVSGNCFVNLGDTYGKDKSMCMIPERFAWQMIESGWILRNKIIWYKPNHMPESVTDRLTKSYEVVYHFTKSQKYFYDLDAIREPHKENSLKRWKKGGEIVEKTKGWDENSSHVGLRAASNPLNEKGKNPGDVWHINTKPYSKAHFAVYPLELVRRPILAGCPVGGVVLDPFGGSGTTAEFCRKNQRDCIIMELNPEFKPLIEGRSMANIPELCMFG